MQQNKDYVNKVCFLNSKRVILQARNFCTATWNRIMELTKNFLKMGASMVVVANLAACANTPLDTIPTVGGDIDYGKGKGHLLSCAPDDVSPSDNGVVTCDVEHPENTKIRLKQVFGGNGPYRNMLLEVWVPNGTNALDKNEVNRVSITETNANGEKTYKLLSIDNYACHKLWDEMLDIQNGGKNVPYASSTYYPAYLMTHPAEMNNIKNYAHIGNKLIEEAHTLPRRAQPHAEACGQKLLQYSYNFENGTPVDMLGNRYFAGQWATSTNYNGYNTVPSCSFIDGSTMGHGKPAIVNACQGALRDLNVIPK